MKIPEQIFDPQAFEKRLNKKPADTRNHFKYLHFRFFTNIIDWFNFNLSQRTKGKWRARTIYQKRTTRYRTRNGKDGSQYWWAC